MRKVYKTYYAADIDVTSGLSIDAYEIGNELYTRKIINIHQSEDTDDDVTPTDLFLDIDTTKKLILSLQKAVDSFEKEI